MEMRMGMGLEFGLRHEQRLILSEAQKLGLEALLRLEQKLVHPEIPEARRGAEGMRSGHDILKERGAVGVLIGGVAEAIWNKKRTVEELAQEHKDVDILVVTPEFTLEKNFEAGIDWWLPESGTVQLRSDISRVYGHKATWWKNGHDVVLGFGVTQYTMLPAGLYLPNPEWILKMRSAEAAALIDTRSGRVTVDEDVFDAFRRKVGATMKKSLIPEVGRTFREYVLDERFTRDAGKAGALGIVEMDIEQISAIHSHLFGATAPESAAEIPHEAIREDTGE